MKQYNAANPIKQGYKICVGADKTYYMCEFQIHTGEASNVTGKSLGARVVRGLAREIAEYCHHVCFDNSFTSADLIIFLRQMEFQLVGLSVKVVLDYQNNENLSIKWLQMTVGVELLSQAFYGQNEEIISRLHFCSSSINPVNQGLSIEGKNLIRYYTWKIFRLAIVHGLVGGIQRQIKTRNSINNDWLKFDINEGMPSIRSTSLFKKELKFL